MGKGRRIGMGMGQRTSVSANPSALQGLEQEIKMLKARSQAMTRQLSDIQHRIEELEKK